MYKYKYIDYIQLWEKKCNASAIPPIPSFNVE